MNRSIMKGLLAVALVPAMAGAAQAQSWNAEQSGVWKAVSATWEADLKSDDSWILRDTHPSVAAWGRDYPAPRGREGVKRWSTVSLASRTMTAYDLAPLAISVVGNSAIAHYYYTSAYTDKAGKTEVSHGRCSDTMVRENGRWLFLGWSCSDEPKKD